jgi:peptidoglycan/xylan/chitin deacetylase (PgdA/CDA1 family)
LDDEAFPRIDQVRAEHVGAGAQAAEVLAAEFRPTSLSDLAAQVAAAEIAPGAVAVTFDDGYADNHEIAWPILTELRIPATFFIAGIPLATPTEAWWDTLERILLGPDEVPERLRLETSGYVWDLPTGDDRARRTALRSIHTRLLTSPREEVDEVVGKLRAWSGVALAPRDSHRLMSPEEVIELSRSPGHSIGAHTVDHLALPMLTADQAIEQMRLSKADLEHLIERPVELLAYPYGACDASVADAAEKVGFLAACTTEPAAVTRDSDPLRLPSLELAREDTEGFRLSLAEALDQAL